MITVSSKSSLGGEAVTLTASKIITLVITMLTSMLLARYRTIEEYGTYSQLLLVVNLVSSLMMLGLPNSINYFLARADSLEEKKKFLSVYYTLNTILSVIIGIVLVMAIPLIEIYFHNAVISHFFYFLALYPWTSIISASIENILIVYQKVHYLIVYRVIYSIAMLASVVFVQWLGYGFDVYMKWFVGINCFFSLLVYTIASKISGGIGFLLDKSWICDIFKFSIPIGLATAVGTLNAEIDKLLIGYLMDTESMAIYTNAAKELPVTIVASSITAVLLPRLTTMVKNQKTKEAIQLWGYATELAFLVIAFIVAGVFVYAEEVMMILYSDKYLPGVSVFRVYNLNLLLRCTYFGIILNAYGETKKIFYCSMGSLVLNAILNPLLYWMFGMIGPAIATFLAILLILLLQLNMTARISHVKFRALFPWKRLFMIAFINVIFAVCFWWGKGMCPLDKYVGNVMEAVLLGILWMIIYVLLMRRKFIYVWNKLNQKEDAI